MSGLTSGRPERVALWSELEDRAPAYALVADVDLVVIRFDDRVSVLYGRCLHRGALLSDGSVEGDNLICGVHYWDYRIDSGISEYENAEALHSFGAWIDTEADSVYVDADEVAAWAERNPQPYRRDEYLGLYADIHGATEEPHNRYIQQLAREGLSRLGHHGVVSAMGVPLTELPRWDDIQVLTAQLARRPLADDDDVFSGLVIGPNAERPLRLDIPIFVSDMSYGALSEEAKTALARGAEMASTGICSGEGGMLPEEQAENSRYLYELASGRFGGRIAEVRGIPEGQPAISPSRFPDLATPADFAEVASQVRDVTGGIPVGFKLSAQHIEEDLDFALEAGVDYVILDGRGGATGAAPDIFKSNISVPTMAALARARHHLDARSGTGVTLIITGGLRTESDFVKALALGADGVAISNSALQAIGCLGMRACHTNNCPVGIATQKPSLRERLVIDASARRLANFLEATVELMQVLARACGHSSLADFDSSDLSTWNREVSSLTGIRYAGVSASGGESA
jgi:glutamate synthase domain-containing protein 2